MNKTVIATIFIILCGIVSLAWFITNTDNACSLLNRIGGLFCFFLGISTALSLGMFGFALFSFSANQWSVGFYCTVIDLISISLIAAGVEMVGITDSFLNIIVIPNWNYMVNGVLFNFFFLLIGFIFMKTVLSPIVDDDEFENNA